MPAVPAGSLAWIASIASAIHALDDADSDRLDSSFFMRRQCSLVELEERQEPAWNAAGLTCADLLGPNGQVEAHGVGLSLEDADVCVTVHEDVSKTRRRT